jgi:hypothetical protein
MRNYRTGLLKVTRFAHETTSSSWDSEAVAYAWPAKLEDLDEFGKPFPVVATPLTATIKRFEKNPRNVIIKVIQTFVVPPDTVVVVIPAQLGIQLCE